LPDIQDTKLNFFTKKQAPKKGANMVPLLSWRSIISLGLGLILGIALAFGYLALFNSSALVSSEVNLQVIPPNGAYTTSQDINSKGQYFVAQANSSSFRQYLVQQLNTQAPEYQYTTADLNRMISIQYNNSNVIMYVTASTADEATFLATNIPAEFKKYLIADASTRQNQENENISQQIDGIKSDLLSAQQDLANIQSQQAAGNIQNDPAYITLSAKIKALESELDVQANQISAGIASTNVTSANTTQQEKLAQTYRQIDAVRASLDDAVQQENDLKVKLNDTAKGSSRVMLNAKIKALQGELDLLMTGYDQGGDLSHVYGLAELIVSGDTSSTYYQQVQAKVNVVSTALAEAQNELDALNNPAIANMSQDDLDYLVVKAKIASLNTQLSGLVNEVTRLSVGGDESQSQQDAQAVFTNISTALGEAKKQLASLESQSSGATAEMDLERQLAQQKVDSLNKELTSLNDQLDSLLGGNSNSSSLVDYLVVGSPSEPASGSGTSPRKALLVGGLLGIGVAWVVLNFKWLARLITTPPEKGMM
jgi:hypothetical protein